MTLINTSVLTAAATAIRLITGFLLNKIFAVYVGPTGLAFIGQFQSFIGVVGTVAMGGVTTGVTKYTAEYRENELEQARIWSAAFRITLVASISIAVVCVAASEWLSVILLRSGEYRFIFWVFSVTLGCASMNGLLMAILNGQKEIKHFIRLNILTGLIGFAFSAALSFTYHLYGALLATVLAPAVSAILIGNVVRQMGWMRRVSLRAALDWGAFKKLMKFSLMALTSAATVPVSQMIVRAHLGESFGWEAAGYWQAVTKISDYYLMLVTTSLSVYYLPRLSEIKSSTELIKEILLGYKIIMPAVTLGALSIYMGRGWIINALFTADFEPMADLMLYQLIGDVVKIASWLLGYIMLAKAMTAWFVFTEVFFSATFVMLVLWATEQIGLPGATLAFLLNYGIYLIFLVWLFSRYFKRGADA